MADILEVFMSKLLHIKKFICKVLTCWMPYKYRILYRDALYWFSFSDYWRFKHANFHIVSLGSNCLPRGLTTAIKIKPRRFYGEKSCPFDFWNNADLSKTIHFIETDFSDYFDNLVINEQTFPHDYELPYDKFVERYQNRIKNFRQVMQSDKTLYLIYSEYAQIPLRKDIQKLYCVLERKRNGKPFKLILLTSEYIDNLPQIIQCPEHFVYETGWLVYMINEYGDYNNIYTQYCNRMKAVLFQEIR